MKIFYHNDDDGKCSAAIIVRSTEHESFDCRAIDYKDDFPFDDILPNETIYIVGFSLQKDGDWDKLLALTSNVFWIDHHKTSIDKPGPQHQLRGFREDGKAACVLTWEFVHGFEPLPEVVALIGDWDTWAFKYGDKTRDFHAGFAMGGNAPDNYKWRYLLDNKSVSCSIIDECLKNGKLIRQYQEVDNKSYLKRWGYETSISGYSVIACNHGLCNSTLFDSVNERYDIMAPFVFDGQQFTVSLYTTNSLVDVSEIAKSFGGGGHQGAAGFQCKELPFKRGNYD